MEISKIIHALLYPLRFRNVVTKQETKFFHTDNNLCEHFVPLEFSAISSSCGVLTRDSTTKKTR